ncbi:RNA-binding protein [Candidatus Woesearchaeota archaeon]|jgi:malignant T-cell-amplified sequence|nr:RNA-binding protein [Candidatus Woesearchaeota archaeon]MBT4596231.1 RNA-binding protein [Candidatus Woesearchaeota archaeon]MBT5741546.1 RNA-binding protein [Candidatus Woesearchaeota archaeon]MBT7962973.1 RNA-binding protein [Candidatus Woesearchaeota archaeon]
MVKLLTLSKKEIKKINLENNLNINLKSLVKLIDDFYLSVDNNILFFKYNNNFIPSLKSDLMNLKTVTIDMPAVPFICKGADLMKPGIVELDDFEKDEFVAIIDEKNKKAISICIALFSSNDIKNMSSGKVLKNIHHIGDKIWSFNN